MELPKPNPKTYPRRSILVAFGGAAAGLAVGCGNEKTPAEPSKIPSIATPTPNGTEIATPNIQTVPAVNTPSATAESSPTEKPAMNPWEKHQFHSQEYLRHASQLPFNPELKQALLTGAYFRDYEPPFDTSEQTAETVTDAFKAYASSFWTTGNEIFESNGRSSDTILYYLNSALTVSTLGTSQHITDENAIKWRQAVLEAKETMYAVLPFILNPEEREAMKNYLDQDVFENPTFVAMLSASVDPNQSPIPGIPTVRNISSEGK